MNYSSICFWFDHQIFTQNEGILIEKFRWAVSRVNGGPSSPEAFRETVQRLSYFLCKAFTFVNSANDMATAMSHGVVTTRGVCCFGVCSSGTTQKKRKRLRGNKTEHKTETEYLLHGPNWQLNYKLKFFFFPAPIHSLRLNKYWNSLDCRRSSFIHVDLFEDFQLETVWA